MRGKYHLEVKKEITYHARKGTRKIYLCLKVDLGVIGKRGRTKRSPYMRKGNLGPDKCFKIDAESMHMGRLFCCSSYVHVNLC